MKTIIVKCKVCGNSFEKPKNEYNRRIKLGKTDFYCNLKCSGNRDNNKSMLLDIGKNNLFKGGERKYKTKIMLMDILNS